MSRGLRGTARVPGDKSTAHRAFLLAALAEGPSRIVGVPASADVEATLTCLAALGTSLSERDGVWTVEPAGGWSAGLDLDARNSGTTARLLAGALAARSSEARVLGDASLSRRPMERVAEPLRALGADVTTSRGGLPLMLRPSELQAAHWEARVPSAQVKSAFLFAALGAEGTSSYREAQPTRDHGERLLRSFGAELSEGPDGRLILQGGRPLTGTELRVAGDPSSAAVLLTAALLVPGSEVRVEGVDESPSRRGFVRVLQAMGGALEEEAGGALAARSSLLSGVDVPASELPLLIDEVPLLVLAAAHAEGESRFEGLGELRHKESDRLSALVELLEALGVESEIEGDDLWLRGGAALRPVRLDPRGDHRLAMLGALLALLVPGTPAAQDPCVAVSWPAFYDDLRRLLR